QTFLLNGEEWKQAYLDLGIDPVDPDHTNQFMEALLQTGREIVFLIPPQLYDYEDEDEETEYATRKEMDYLLDHPEESGNVTLVFGAYDLLNPEWYRENVSTTQRQKLVAE